LPHNDINCFHRDDNGFLWIGTLSGLARFDGSNFKNFHHNPKSINSLDDNDVRSIKEGPAKKLWIETRAGTNIYDATTNFFSRDLESELLKYDIREPNVQLCLKSRSGVFIFLSATTLYFYDPNKRKTTQFEHRSNISKTVSQSKVVDVAEDHGGNFWLIRMDGTLELFHKNTGLISEGISFSEKFSNLKNDSYRIFVDKQGLLWVYNVSVAAGIYCYNPVNRNLLKFNSTSGSNRLTSDMISGIIQDENDNVWIATDHGGVNILSKPDMQIVHLRNKQTDDRSLSQNSISSIYCDFFGVVWIGTFRKGVNLYHPDVFKFGLIQLQATGGAPAYNDVNALEEDHKGNIWIGTNGNGLHYYNRKTNQSKFYKHESSQSGSLSHDAVVSIYIDRSKKVWAGTYLGGLNYFDNGEFKHYVHDPYNKQSLSDNRVATMFEDSKRRFWIGTGGGGINLMDRSSETFKRYSIDNGKITSDYVFKILEDRKHNIWVGTSYGIHLFVEKEDKFSPITKDVNDENSLVNDNINSFIEDNRGYLWICTRAGLSIYNPQTKVFQNFTIMDGLPDNNLTDIRQDHNGEFWISTSNGISRIVAHYGKNLVLQFDNFDKYDGLQGKEFNRSASAKLRTGELAFAGPDGVNIFFPDSMQRVRKIPAVFITDFHVFGADSSTALQQGYKIDSGKSILNTKNITLKHDQNIFAIEFATLNFTGPDRVRYLYMLEGFDKIWIESSVENRKVTYTNVPPGKYVFKIKALNRGEEKDADIVSLNVRIKSPWYDSTLAYIVYALIVASIILFLRRKGIQRLKEKFAFEQQKAESDRLIENERLTAMRNRELDALKIKFFTNVSHEFRTPLSLIMAPAEKILNSNFDNTIKDPVLHIQKNAKRLLNLVNQLLDFREMEMKELKLQKRKGEIVSFIRDATYSFKDLGDKKSIHLSFISQIESLDCSFDHEKIERILFNLLSNSFKFTPPGGKVGVWLNYFEENVSRPVLEIKVMDTGVGIPKDKHKAIFESFFQYNNNKSIINQGSGIGLSIIQEFVKIYDGTIHLESEEGLGSCFTVTVPCDRLYDISNKLTTVSDVVSTADEEELSQPQLLHHEFSSKKMIVLIVEDDDDLRFYIKDSLQAEFHVIEAKDGKEGWQKALFYHPNIIVSDISMPLMDGILLCKKVKADNRTSQIPVMLLTALSGEAHELMGLEMGANDYITKPFSLDVLRSKIRNLLSQQESARKRYSRQVEVRPPEVALEGLDEQFLQEVLVEIEKNIDNCNFSVDMLSKVLLISRGTLYTRILTLTGKTPLEFIKSYRLTRAAQLLEQGKFSVSVITYKTGFKTTKNFVKSFKDKFGMTPSTYTEAMKNS